MIIGMVTTESGIVYGKIKIKDLILTNLSMKKEEDFQRYITLYPLKNFPFYENYDKLFVHPKSVSMQFIKED